MTNLITKNVQAWPRFLFYITVTILLFVSCGPTAPPNTPTPSPAPATAEPIPPTPTEASITPPPDGLSIPADYTIELIVSDLRGPTQMILGPDNRLWVAQLNGPESEDNGQIVAIDLVTGDREVLLTDLFKPTGVAVIDETIWVASGRDILRAPLVGTGTVGPPEVALSDLPFNGRSNGTLTVSPEGLLLYETSGRRSGNRASTGSATLWALDPEDPQNPQPVATGLKGAYAHTFDVKGRLWTTEIGDDLVNDGVAPPDELNLVVEDADFGWPQCFGQQEPALNFGGTEAECQTTRAPVVLFAPRSTPTSVVASPWEDDVLFVALWGPAEQTVVRVVVTSVGDNAVGTYDVFLSGLENPQHLLVLPDQSLLVSDFRTGKTYRVRKQ